MKIGWDQWQRAVDYMRQRQRGYQLLFSTPHGKAVLADLHKFCRADQSCWHPDARLHAILEGRREVWLRIQTHFRLTPDQMAQLAMGNPDLEITQQGPTE